MTNDITFPVLFTHLKTLDSYSSDNICGIRITEAVKQIETIAEEIEEEIEEDSESHPILFLFFLFFIVVLVVIFLYKLFGRKKEKSKTDWVRLDRSISVDSDGSPVELP